MNEKEVAELRRHLHPDRHTIVNVHGCYVSAQKKIISTFRQSMGMLRDEEREQYLTLFKKSLSGGLGRNLLEIPFTTMQVAEGEEHAFLMGLRESRLEDREALDEFYQKVIETLEGEENYLILIAHSNYDVPYRSKTDVFERDSDRSEEVFSHLLCSICPVKEGKSGLSYDRERDGFHMDYGDDLVAPPVMGFLFPAFDERRANLYSALFYTKDIKDTHEAFIDKLFHTQAPKSAPEQKAGFEAVLSNALEDECSMEVVQSVHQHLRTLIAEHKESKVPQPLTITRAEVDEVLEGCGVSEPKLAAFHVRFDEEFGSGEQVSPKNLIDSKKFEVKTPSVSIKVDPDFLDQVQTKYIDGIPYITIRVDEGVEVNGVTVELPKEST
jgi:hypothetical protein